MTAVVTLHCSGTNEIADSNSPRTVRGLFRVRGKKALINSINKMKLTRSNIVKQKKNLLKKQTNVQMKQPTCMTPCANCCYDNREC